MVSASVPLKRRGRDFWGCCPFHQPDKTGSFKVGTYRGKERFYCFGCHARGDAIDWIMLTQRVDFKDARRILGQEAAKPDPAIKERRRAAQWREYVVGIFLSRNPDTVCPDFLLETPPIPAWFKLRPEPKEARKFSDEEMDRILAALWSSGA
jgi:hypothetical protein